jgi:hypothetical protein
MPASFFIHSVFIKYIVTYMIDSRRGYELDIEFIDHLRIVTTGNYKILTELTIRIPM